jgi:hypothetical protein
MVLPRGVSAVSDNLGPNFDRRSRHGHFPGNSVCRGVKRKAQSDAHTLANSLSKEAGGLQLVSEVLDYLGPDLYMHSYGG